MVKSWQGMETWIAQHGCSGTSHSHFLPTNYFCWVWPLSFELPRYSVPQGLWPLRRLTEPCPQVKDPFWHSTLQGRPIKLWGHSSLLLERSKKRANSSGRTVFFSFFFQRKASVCKTKLPLPWLPGWRRRRIFQGTLCGLVPVALHRWDPQAPLTSHLPSNPMNGQQPWVVSCDLRVYAASLTRHFAWDDH